MKVLDYVKKFNKVKKLSLEGISCVKQYYLSMYRFYMLKLYEAGYIDDPTVFNVAMIRRNIIDLNIRGITSEIGSFILTPDRVRYAYYKNTDESQKEFLSLLYDVLLYREYSISIDNFYEVYGGSVSLQLKLQEGRVVSSKNVSFNKANLRVLTEEDVTLDVYDINQFKLRKIFEILGIEYKDYVIDSNLTCDDLCWLLDVVFGEHPPNELDGEYADIVKNWFKTYNRSILSHLYSHYALDLLGELSKKAREFNTDDIVCISDTNIYVKRKMQYRYYPIGFFNVIGGFDGDSFLEDSKINGYTGEGYLEKYLQEEGFSYVGVPVLVNGKYIYDREQTNINSESWFKSNEAIFSFDEPTINNVATEQDAMLSTKQGILGILKI